MKIFVIICTIQHRDIQGAGPLSHSYFYDPWKENLQDFNHMLSWLSKQNHTYQRPKLLPLGSQQYASAILILYPHFTVNSLCQQEWGCSVQPPYLPFLRVTLWPAFLVLMFLQQALNTDGDTFSTCRMRYHPTVLWCHYPDPASKTFKTKAFFEWEDQHFPACPSKDSFPTSPHNELIIGEILFRKASALMLQKYLLDIDEIACSSSLSYITSQRHTPAEKREEAIWE